MAYTTIDNPELYFQCKNFVGSSSAQSITLDGSEDMQPDFIWFKNRETSSRHQLYDSVRGATKLINSDHADAEQTVSYFTSFDSDGFTIPSGSSALNGGSQNIIAWCWKESADSGMDIVSYTGNGSARTISHSLSAVPKMIIVKDRDDADYSWHVYHEAVGNGKTFYLDIANTPDTNSIYWNDTSPTSSVFSVGTSVTTNKSSDDFIAYLFTPKQGYSAMGSYTGNANADGTFVFLGFQPAFVMVKNIDAAENWIIFDNKRPGYNLTDALLKPNLANAESTSGVKFDLLSNGFKARVSDAEGNSSNTFIYMAFAEAPFVNSNGVPCNAR
jgi:hypothetical protein